LDPRAPASDANGAPPEQQIDALSGATSPEIGPSIVRGALYSCHAIWHLAHGDVRQQMIRHLGSVFTPAMATQFLNSEYTDYQVHALREMSPDRFEKNLPRVQEIFRDATTSTRLCILQRLPKDLWRNQRTTQALYCRFSGLDVETKSMLLENLVNADPCAGTILADQVETMNKSQLKVYLSHLSEDPASMNASTRAKLQRVATDERYAYCYVIDAFLRER
jgi:hypothetical protein